MLRQYRRGNQKWAIQKNLATSSTQDEKKQIKHTAHYVLKTTIRQQTQIT